MVSQWPCNTNRFQYLRTCIKLRQMNKTHPIILLIIHFEKYFYKTLMIKYPIKLCSSVISNTTPHICCILHSSQAKRNPFTYILFGVCGFKIIYKVTAAVTSTELADAILVTAVFNIYTKCTCTCTGSRAPRIVTDATGI